MSSGSLSNAQLSHAHLLGVCDLGDQRRSLMGSKDIKGIKGLLESSFEIIMTSLHCCGTNARLHNQDPPKKNKFATPKRL